MRNILFRTSLIVSLVVLVSIPAFAQMKIGDSPTSITTGAQLDIEKSGSRTVFMDTGKVGIGDVSPASLLTVGSGDLFQVDSTGNIVKINNVTTSFPSSQGSAGTILTNNGSGTLTWSAPAGISADALNFTDLSDSLLLDASTDIFSSGTNVLSVTNSGTGLSFRVNDDGTLTDSTPFAIDASGNVGIGVAAPASKLDVAGSIRFSTAGSEKLIATNGGTTFLEYDSTGNVFLRAYDGGGTVRDIALQTGTPATTRLFIDENGLVGIGDTTPAAMLTVGSGDLFQVNSSGSIAAVAGITMTSGALSIPNGDLGSGSTLRFKNASAANDAAIYETNGNILMVHAGASNSIVLRDSSSNYGAWFNFAGSGFTFNNIYDDAASRATLILNRSRSSATAPAAGFGTYLDFNLEGYTNTSQVSTGKISSIWENTQTNDTTDRDAALTFSTTADNASSEKMRITSGGNVGIGSTGPNAKLSISNNVATGFLDNYNEYQLLTYDGGTAGGSYGQGVITNTMVFNSGAGGYNFDKAGTSTLMSIDGSGNLVVAGTIKATTFGTSSATTLCHTGNIIALCTSSARYKENIQNLTEGMDVIKKLRPVSFKWKVRDEQSVGFIAEDVQKVDPRLTFNNDKGQVEGVHYQLITSYLTKAMQELSVTTDQNTADIKDLKKENADMKAEISDLKTRLESLEQKLK